MEDSRATFTAVIKKQMEILGSDITLARVRNVPGIKVDQEGNVISGEGETQFLLEQLTNQFVELSGLIIKKTMESILSVHPMAQVSQVLPVLSPTNGEGAGVLAADNDIEELNKALNNLNIKNSQ